MTDVQKISLIKRNLNTRLTFKLLNDTSTKFLEYVINIRKIDRALIMIEKINSKPEKKSRGNNRREGGNTNSFSIPAKIFTTTVILAATATININFSTEKIANRFPNYI
jgi:hypothetical protein